MTSFAAETAQQQEITFESTSRFADAAATESHNRRGDCPFAFGMRSAKGPWFGSSFALTALNDAETLPVWFAS